MSFERGFLTKPAVTRLLERWDAEDRKEDAYRRAMQHDFQLGAAACVAGSPSAPNGDTSSPHDEDGSRK